ncbi:hypothetical protein [Caldibacillus debilis]|uniref:hypothetical protein n=1 Tax=Caldibacillus debilis TaxID=301148 RepID=UPI000E361F4A|nr:hypothetical protein [Caldibacillus debilis]REJ29261.1 MAG: hypothetical protein C6W56_05900 [Caldibacillus debilis]
MKATTLNELEGKYGKELVEQIKQEIEICHEYGYKFGFWIDENEGFIIDKVFFVTPHEAVIFEVIEEGKICMGKHRVTRSDCKKAIERMDRIWEREINCSTHTSH